MPGFGDGWKPSESATGKTELSPEISEKRIESSSNISVIPPALESFLQRTNQDALWLEEVKKNKEFSDQVTARRELNERLDAVLSKLPRPDVSLQEAVKSGDLKEESVAELYTALSALLEGDTDYQRIILYLPFEFLPSADWEPASVSLKHASDRFREAYLSAWDNLLYVQDVRANFVDGDVLGEEERVGDHPRVVKAAHLIPKLVEKGFLATEDVLRLMNETENEVLKKSIAEALLVVEDLGFLQASDLDQRTIDRSATPSPQKKISKKREEWLQKEKERKAIESAGDQIGAAILRGTFDDATAAEQAMPEANVATQQALIDGIRKAIESTAHADPSQAQVLYTKYRDTLISLWKHDVPEIHEALSKTFCRLHGLDVIDEAQLHALGLTIPAIAGPFSENLKQMKKETDELKETSAAIEKDAELSNDIYPVVIVFGSRLKGYGAPTADVDVAVFVKPGTSPIAAEKMRPLIGREVTEFWLEETSDGLRVRDDAEQPGAVIGDSSWTYVLFGGAWEGDAKTINKLREQLLVPYFYETDKKIRGRSARKLYLEELERDLLQYRLMHKGYERFFPSFGGIQTPRSDRIDGKSTFWDSGYRQMATRLFARRVFLPKISRTEEK